MRQFDLQHMLGWWLLANQVFLYCDQSLPKKNKCAILLFNQGFHFLRIFRLHKIKLFQWGSKYTKIFIIFLLKTPLLESNCPKFIRKIASFEINHPPNVPRGSALLSLISVWFSKILSWRGSSQLHPYFCRRTSHPPLNLNKRRSSIQWNWLPCSPRCWST